MTNYLTIRQACQRLQVCRNTLLAMIADGNIKAVNLRRPGGKYDIWRIEFGTLYQEVQEMLKLREIERKIGI